MIRPPPISPLSPYPPLSRSCCRRRYLPRPERRSRSRGFHGLSLLAGHTPHPILARAHHRVAHPEGRCPPGLRAPYSRATRSEEHTSELPSRLHLVCRLLLDKKHICGKTPGSAFDRSLEASALLLRDSRAFCCSPGVRRPVRAY